MSFFALKKTLTPLLAVMVLLSSTQAFAGGIVLGGTRVIYPANQKQVSLSVRNTSEQQRFMVQSWAEDASGKKTDDFIVTPPLYVSNPGQENTLRLMYTGKSLPSDRETLYYLNSKAIPALDKNKLEGRNVLMLSTSTRIKMFIRPQGLTPEVSKAPDMLTFRRNGQQLAIGNPTPYYITLVKVKAGENNLDNVMIAPKSSSSIRLPSAKTTSISFQTVNDFGGYTSKQNKTLP